MKKRIRVYENQYKKLRKEIKSNAEYAAEGVRNMEIIMKKYNHFNKK